MSLDPVHWTILLSYPYGRPDLLDESLYHMTAAQLIAMAQHDLYVCLQHAREPDAKAVAAEITAFVNAGLVARGESPIS